MRCFPLRGWRLGLLVLLVLLGSCRPENRTPPRITAANYLTAISNPQALGRNLRQ